MGINQTPEFITLDLDPLWLKHGEQIRTVREIIEAPKTTIGEKISRNAFNSTVFIVYNRLQPVFSSLVTLTEYDEIGKAEGKSYFSKSVNQRIVLKAFRLLIDDVIKLPFGEKEVKKYEDYRQFFEATLLRLGQLDKQIEQGLEIPNFINSLAMIISQEIARLKGVENFKINIGKIRSDIIGYLPQLEQIDDGGLLSEIKTLLEIPLAYQEQNK